jgi:hypothetical protein
VDDAWIELGSKSTPLATLSDQVENVHAPLRSQVSKDSHDLCRLTNHRSVDVFVVLRHVQMNHVCYPQSRQIVDNSRRRNENIHITAVKLIKRRKALIFFQISNSEEYKFRTTSN